MARQTTYYAIMRLARHYGWCVLSIARNPRDARTVRKAHPGSEIYEYRADDAEWAKTLAYVERDRRNATIPTATAAADAAAAAEPTSIAPPR